MDQAGTVFAAVIEQAKAAQDPRLEGRGLNGRGDVLVAQGDGPGAQAAYQVALAIAESLAKRDPAKTGWQVDVAISYAKLGSLDSLVSMQQRKEYLSRGLKLLSALKQAGRLHANQDWSSWFYNALRSLK